MTWFKRYRYLLTTLTGLLVLGLVACQPKLTPEEDCNFVMSSQIQRVSWKGQIPINLYISQGVPVQYRESIRKAASQWNYDTGKTLFVILEQEITNNPKKDDLNGIYWLDKWGGRVEEQAKTTIYWRGDRIKEADILINAENYHFSQFGSATPSTVDMTSLMVHELGHVLGLQHIVSEPSVMAESLPTLVATAAPTQAGLRQEPTDLDLNSLKCEY